MTTKHTPGKLFIDSALSAHGTPIIRAKDNNAAICYLSINRHLGEDSPSQQESANATLIAQAPNLLAERDRLAAINVELVAALERINDGQVMSGEWTHADTVVAYQSIARAAIARAEEGKQ